MDERLTLQFQGPGDSDPSNHNTDVIDEQEVPRNDFNPETSWWRRKSVVVGTGVLAIVAAGGLAFGLKGGDSEGRPQQPQPTATAGLAPGEGAASAAPSAPEAIEPSIEATPVDMNEWTEDDFVYHLNDGTTVKGVAELEAKYGIKVEDYPTGDAAAKKLIDNVNLWLNSLDTAADKENYAAYNGKNQLVRGAGIAYDIAPLAWKRVLTTDERAEGSANAPGADAWIETMRNLNVQHIQDAAKQRNAGGKDNHYAGFKVKNVNVLTTYQGETAFIIDMTYVGPDRKVDVVLNATMRQVKGENGEMMWKLIGLTDEAKE